MLGIVGGDQRHEKFLALLSKHNMNESDCVCAKLVVSSKGTSIGVREHVVLR